MTFACSDRTRPHPTGSLCVFRSNVITDSGGRLSAVFEVTDRAWVAQTLREDDHLSRHGHVMEILSEHTCEGWLEGYLLTGRHGLFSCYEAFIHIVDSMFNQHAKWLKESREIPWRRPIEPLQAGERPYMELATGPIPPAPPPEPAHSPSAYKPSRVLSIATLGAGSIPPS